MWDRFKMWFFDKLSVDRNMPCHAFGGIVRSAQPPITGGFPPLEYEVRLCTKNRWHIDSHAYEFVPFPYQYVTDEKGN